MAESITDPFRSITLTPEQETERKYTNYLYRSGFDLLTALKIFHLEESGHSTSGEFISMYEGPEVTLQQLYEVTQSPAFKTFILDFAPKIIQKNIEARKENESKEKQKKQAEQQAKQAERSRILSLGKGARRVEISSLTVPHLKEICSEYRISSSGTKATLIEKILKKEFPPKLNTDE